MDCTKPHLLALAGLLFLLATLGFATASAAPSEVSPQQRFRYVAWDCSDWSMTTDFGADRGRAILEMLALNRGMTLYCGAEQSNILTKAELWAAGREHNERDDTVYWGERGSFRGFTAPQEGWLTDGASGITGISLHRVFEFPREERKRRRSRSRSTEPTIPVITLNQQQFDSRATVGAPIVIDPEQPVAVTWYYWKKDSFPYVWDLERSDIEERRRELFSSLQRVSEATQAEALASVNALVDPLAQAYYREASRAGSVCSIPRETLVNLRNPGMISEIVRISPEHLVRLNGDVWVYNWEGPEGSGDFHYNVLCRAEVVRQS